MATVAEKVHEYFASLNPLAHKILQETDAIKAQYGTEWDTFTVEKQDEILDNHFVNPEVKAQYPDKNEYPECFPRLKVNCGEKIVVDFDNDGWTWRDEHSGPFSWYSRSEQDLSILDLEDLPPPEKEKKKGKKGKGKKKGKKPRLPPPPPPDGIQPEKSIWESPFLAAEREMEESNLSMDDELEDEDDKETNEADKQETHDKQEASKPDVTVMLSPSKTCTPPTQVAIDEETKLLDSSFDSTGHLVVNPEPAVAPPRKNKKKKDAPKKAPPPPPTEKRKKQSSESETLVSMQSLNIGTSMDAEGGQVSPVYVEHPGESSTDPVVTQQPQSIVDQGEGQINMAMDDDDWTSTSFSKATDDSALKTGFDFLDNW